jgi:hypothetical protein
MWRADPRTDATTDGDASLLIRDKLGNWAEGTGSISIQYLSLPAVSFSSLDSVKSGRAACCPVRRSPR